MVLSRPLPYGADLCRGSARLFHSAQSGSCGERREWPPDFQGGPKQSDDSGGHCSGRPAAARRGQIAAGVQHRNGDRRSARQKTKPRADRASRRDSQTVDRLFFDHHRTPCVHDRKSPLNSVAWYSALSDFRSRKDCPCAGTPATKPARLRQAMLQHRQTARHLRESLILVSGFSTPGFATPFKGLDEVVDSWPRSAFPACVKLSADKPCVVRSEEHTSELQSRLHLVCRLLLEKKKLN